MMERIFTGRYTFILISYFFLLFQFQGFSNNRFKVYNADVIIYGGTSSAVIAAVETVQSGKSAIIVSPETHLGGMSSEGLGYTDTGMKETIGGLARDFYHRIYEHYQKNGAWRWMKKEDYGDRGRGSLSIDGKERTIWTFEPHIAENVFEELIGENNITVFRDEWLDREKGVKKCDKKIVCLSTLSGKTFKGKIFIDATYEGDLMAAGGVSYHVGREGNNVYNETWNGIQTGVYFHRHHFKVLSNPIDPYWIPGDPSSGLLPGISSDPPGEKGKGDHRIQAYCFRVCMTDHPENRIPFPKPDGYDSTRYELLLRIFDTGWR
jgi:hypothetical protein